jgi:NADPH-dependent ferric siderophore reductase
MSDSTERVRYRDKTTSWSVSVTAVERIGQDWVKITCDMPSNASLSLGDTIAIDVEPTQGTLRRYSISFSSDNSFEVIAHRTQLGPATQYLDQLSQGDLIHGQGPERPIKLPTQEMKRVAVLGDKTLIGTAAAIAQSTTMPVQVAMKTETDATGIQDLLCGATHAICKTDDEMLSWLTEFARVNGTNDVGIFLVGEQAANQTLRQHAFGLGIAKERVATRTFWRPDKSGLE